MNEDKTARQKNLGRSNPTIKICGLTREQDIESVSLASVDQAGFVFAPSRRRLSILQAATLIKQLPTSIEPVGVFADAEPSLIIEAIEKAGIQIVQLHGSETDVYIRLLRRLLPTGIKIWKSHSFAVMPDKYKDQAQLYCIPENTGDVRARHDNAHNPPQTVLSFNEIHADGLPDAWLLDSIAGSQSGGTGRPFDWSGAGRSLPCGRRILAGGINIDNVREATLILKPDGIDCSSGVEIDGFKDRKRIIEFCEFVRSINY